MGFLRVQLGDDDAYGGYSDDGRAATQLGKKQGVIYQAVAAKATLNGNQSAFGALQSPATNSSKR